MFKYQLAFLGILIVFMTGCSSLLMQQPSKDRLTSMTAPPPPIEEIPFSEDEAEKELAAILQSWESLEQSVTIEPNKNGFTVNGQKFLDPDGKIVKYATNYSTGDVTYLLVDKDSGEYLIKTSRVPQVTELSPFYQHRFARHYL